jgi:hypothetical protein
MKAGLQFTVSSLNFVSASANILRLTGFDKEP